MAAKPAAPEYATVNVPIADVVPYVRNPRKNTDAVAKVAASIREFGFRQPIVCDADMVVIAGHTRLQAAQSLGLKTVPVHVAAGLSEAQIAAYRLADNRTGQEATWDSDLLTTELTALVGLDFDLALTGFNPDELARLLGDVREVEFGGLPDGAKPDFEQMTFTLHTSQADTVREAMALAKSVGPFVDTPNENSNGNALARIAEAAFGALR
jgi:ParB-like chromosome segregation protein Spo0J